MATVASAIASVISVVQNATGAIKNRVNQITAQSQGLDSSAVFQLTGSALSNLQDQINNTRQQLLAVAQALSSVAGGTSSVATATVKVVQLTTSTTNITQASAATGNFLIVVLTQDATGGRLITWDTNFRYTTVNIDTTASTTSVFVFVSSIDPNVGTNQWFMSGIPLTGAS